MKRIAVLVTSAGVESAVSIIRSLKLQTDVDIEIVAVDIDRLASGLHLANHFYISPPISDSEQYFGFLCDVCKKHEINVLYPCYSKEISLIAEKKNILSEQGIATLLPSKQIIDLCNNKLAISQLADKLQIPTPKTINYPTLSNLPIFSKRLKGSASTGAVLVNDGYILNHLIESDGERIYQEYISGQEYTVDALCDNNHNLIFCGPRKRISVKAGQTVKGETIHSGTLNTYVNRLCSAVSFVGACNIQFIERDGLFYFIEMNPRYAAGGLMLTVHAGANLPLLALKIMLGMPIKNSEVRHEKNVFMSRYWNEVIIKN